MVTVDIMGVVVKVDVRDKIIIYAGNLCLVSIESGHIQLIIR